MAGQPNSRLLHMPERGGPGAATYRGLQECRGRYCQRLDQDDEVLPAGLTEALRGGVAVNAKAVIQPYQVERPNRALATVVRRPWSGRHRGDAYWLGWAGAPWATMVDMEVVRRGGVVWPSLPWGGDMVFLALAMSRIPLERVHFSAVPSYLWRHRQGSLSHPEMAAATGFIRERRKFVAAHNEAMESLRQEGLATSRDVDRARLRFSGQLVRAEWAGGMRASAWRRCRDLWGRYWGNWRFWRLLLALLFPRWTRRPSLLFRALRQR